MDMDESEGWCLSKEVASTMGGNVGSHSEANNVELSVTLTSCNREVTGSMWTRACLQNYFDEHFLRWFMCWCSLSRGIKMHLRCFKIYSKCFKITDSHSHPESG